MSGNYWKIRTGGISALVNTVAPVIAGAPGATEGSLFAVTAAGSYTGPTPTLTYQWTRDGVDITGETGSTYQTISTDVGKAVACKEIATRGAATITTASNAITVINGILVAVSFRDTGTTVSSRYIPYNQSDSGTTVTRSPVSGPAASYVVATSGSIGWNTDDAGTPSTAGFASISGSGGRIKIPGLPKGAPLMLRFALGPNSSTSTSALTAYDGDPDAGGAVLFHYSVSTPGGSFADASGATETANLWEGTNVARSITLDPLRNGDLWFKQNSVSGGLFFMRAVVVHWPSFGAEVAGVGPYFVKVGGDNAKDGKSLSNAWANLPGDPDAVAGNVAAFTLLPGAVVNVEGGQIHKPAGFGARKQFLFQRAAGTSSDPIVIQPRPGSGEPVFEGSEDLAFTTAALSGDVGGNANYANITYQTFGSAIEWNAAPVCGPEPLRPAVWPSPSAITAYDDSDSGSDAFWAENTVTGPGGSSSQWITGANDSAGTGYKTVTYTGSKVLSRYGSVSINGYIACVRMDGNQVEHQKILSHTTGSGQFTFKIGNGQDLFASTSDFDFLWQIRYHPFDIVQQGQYGLSSDQLKVFGWFPASGVRGISRLTRGVTAQYSDWTITGIQWRHFQGGDSVKILSDTGLPFAGHSGSQYFPNRIKFSGKIRSTSDYARDYLIQFSGAGTGHDVSDLDVADNFTKGGLFFGNNHDSTANRLKFRESGRTLFYAGSDGNGPSQDNTLLDLDFSDCSGIHANGGTAYQDSRRIIMRRILGLNHIRPMTSQGNTTGYVKAHEIGYAALTGRLQPAGAPHITSLITITNDNHGVNSWWHHMFVGEGVGMHLGDDSAGMVVENAYISYLGAAYGVLSGVIFRNCVIAGGTYTSLSDLKTHGPADASSYNVTFTGTAYDGTITAAARQAITANGNLGTYSDVTLGMSTTGRGWFIPAYGTNFVLSDPSLTTANVRLGHRALLPFGQFFNTQPESALSLPSGVVDNNLFGLIRGKPYFLASATAGTYTLRLRQTNNSANNTGSTTRDTDFTITVA